MAKLFWTAPAIKELIAMREAGASYEKCALHFGVSERTIRDEMRRRGITVYTAKRGVRSNHYLPPSTAGLDGMKQAQRDQSANATASDRLEDAIEALVRRTADKLAIPQDYARKRLAYARQYLGIEPMARNRKASIAQAKLNAAMMEGRRGYGQMRLISVST